MSLQSQPSEDVRGVQQGELQLLHSRRCVRRGRGLLLLPDEAQQTEGESGLSIKHTTPGACLTL